MLTDRRATRANILKRLEVFLDSCHPGSATRSELLKRLRASLRYEGGACPGVL